MPARHKKNHNKRKSPGGSFRVVAGEWRSQRFPFPDIPGLRPTTDRIRETLFNWLAADIPGARVLDLFAGSGALGMEALSRGAVQLVAVELNPKACRSLRDNLSRVTADADVYQAEALSWLKESARLRPNIVLLDPPFRLSLLQEAVDCLQSCVTLDPGSLIYIEREQESPEPIVPERWTLQRSKTSGQVTYSLYRVEACRE